MAAKDLITTSRAKNAIQSITDSSQDTLLAVLITAVSDAVAKYCRRDFIARAYDELYTGSGQSRLLLREYPVQSVQSVRYRPATVMQVKNTDTATNQQARVSVLSTGLKLVRVASGIATTTTTGLTWAACATITALVAAVNAVGSSWSAQVIGDSNDYGKWPAADLYIAPSFGDGLSSDGAALTARGVWAGLTMHTAELGFHFDPRGWLEADAFPCGSSFRVQYTAGYTTIPEGVQQVAAEWVAEVYALASRDPNLQIQSVAGTQSLQYITGELPSKRVRHLLAPYRRVSIANNQG